MTVENYETGNNKWLMKQSANFSEPAEGNTLEEILAKVLRGDHQRPTKKISVASVTITKEKEVTSGESRDKRKENDSDSDVSYAQPKKRKAKPEPITMQPFEPKTSAEDPFDVIDSD